MANSEVRAKDPHAGRCSLEGLLAMTSIRKPLNHFRPTQQMYSFLDPHLCEVMSL